MKPCPFCKAKDKYLSVETIIVGEGPLGKERNYVVHCAVCDAYGPCGEDVEEAKQRWDIRQELKDQNDEAMEIAKWLAIETRNEWTLEEAIQQIYNKLAYSRDWVLHMTRR
jgi:hypothetical protein